MLQNLIITIKRVSIRAASAVAARPEYRAWVLSIASSTVKVKSKETRCYILREWSRWISAEPTSQMSPCTPPSDLAFPTLLIFAATKVAGQNCGGNLCRIPPSAPFLDLSPTQWYLHASFVFIFSWPTQLLATALKLFIHVRMQMTHNKQTNLKEIYEDEQFKVLILYFFRNQSVGRGNLQRTRTCLGSWNQPAQTVPLARLR